jgi:hypothetical protein
MTVREAPISRGLIDELLPWLRALLGVIFIAYSANSTIFMGASDLMWLFEPTKQITIGSFADAYWYSSFVALILFVGEVACGERFKRAYWLFLIPDAFYTGRGMWSGLIKAATILAGAWVGDGPVANVVGFITGTIVAAVLGYFIAKWGEVLLFGKRRQIQGAVIRRQRR